MNIAPKEWVLCKISDFSHIVMGQSPSSKTYNANGIGLPFYQGKAEFGALYPDPVKYCKSPKKIAKKGAVLLSVRAPVGPTNINPHISCVGRGLAAIHPLGCMQDKFILYLFRNYEPILSGQGKGTTFKAITKDFLFDLKFTLPSLPEQNHLIEKIEELFSDLDNAVENLKKAREQLKVYRQAVMKYAFEGKLTNDFENWRQTTLGEIISISSGEGLTKAQRKEDGQYLVYGGNGIAGKHSEYLFEKERLIIGRVGAQCGNAHITKPYSWVTDNAFVVTFDENNFDIKYLYHLIISLNLNKHSSSTAQPVISQGKVYPIMIAVPKTIKEQQSVVTAIEFRFSVCDQMEKAIESSLKQAESLRQSILKQAFEGKLTEQWRKEHNDLISGKNSAEALLKKIKAEKEALKKRK